MRVVKHAETEAKTEARLVKRDCGPGSDLRHIRLMRLIHSRNADAMFCY